MLTKFIHHFKRNSIIIIVGFFITLCFLLSTIGYSTIPGLANIDSAIYDLKINASANTKPVTPIVILDIDEKSMAELGRWPWSRVLMAKVNDKLFDEQKISVLGYDIVWAEPDPLNSKSISVLMQQSNLATKPYYDEVMGYIGKSDPDAVFANSLKDRAIALGYYFNNEKNAIIENSLPRPVLNFQQLDPQDNEIQTWRGFTGNLPNLTEAAVTGGYFNPFVDNDGIIRKIPLLAKYDGHYYQSLTLAIVRLAIGSPAILPIVGSDYRFLEALDLGVVQIPVAADATALVPFHEQNSFRYISAVDLLNDKLAPGALEGSIVIMGSSAPGLRDQRATPLASIYAGVEIHANMVDGILNSQIKYTPKYASAIVFLQVLLAGLLLTLSLPLMSALVSLLFSGFMILLAIAYNYYLWQYQNLEVPLASSVVLTSLLFVCNLGIGFFKEGMLKRKLSNIFGQYIPPELVAKMAEDPSNYDFQAKDAELSILFSDIRGFTSISEQLTPTELASYINEYLSQMSSIVIEEKGTLDKYIGDAIMAFWGAPLPLARHAYYAANAALKMQNQADLLAASFAARGLPKFNIGIGLNAGNVRVGDMGSNIRRAYTVMGDPVNLASRLESLTKYYGLNILVGPQLVVIAPEFFYREVDKVRVKGKDEATVIYELIGLDSEVSDSVRQEVKDWSIALAFYYEKDWSGLVVALDTMITQYGSRLLYSVYKERATKFQLTPPDKDWDCITTLA